MNTSIHSYTSKILCTEHLHRVEWLVLAELSEPLNQSWVHMLAQVFVSV